RTLTGSNPTGIDRTHRGLAAAAPETSRISSRLSGVFTARRSEPPGVSVRGETCAVSQLMKLDCAPAGAAAHSAHTVGDTPMSRRRPVTPAAARERPMLVGG